MNRTVLAIFAHPDDIEFVAAGTLLKLKSLDWTIHYMNVANGCCGSTQWDATETARIRLEESRQSAKILKATLHPPICNDLEIFYNRDNLRKIAAVVRLAKPSVILTHARTDYMEDHMETCRLAVTAAFSRSVPNFETEPPTPIVDQDVAIYHAQPHGNRTPDGKLAVPEYFVDIDEFMQQKKAMLACHQSQQDWLQTTQKMNSYVQTMLDLGREVAKIGNLECQFAEGWSRHLHLGFGPAHFDPLREALLK